MSKEFVDLFCGAGGFSCGFEKAGFQAIAGIDWEEPMVETFEANHKDAEGIKHDISEEILDYNTDLVIGSPPCQGFSVAKGGERDIEDERNSRVFDYIKWIEKIQPKVFVMENVAGIRSISDEFIDAVKEKYREMGYSIDSDVLNSAEFGVPQKRKRYFLLGVKSDIEDNPKLPSPTHETSGRIQTTLDGDQLEVLNTVGDALKGLPEVVENIETEVDVSEVEKDSGYLDFVLDENKTINHVAKFPREDEMSIINNIPEGKVYRSNRFGDQYIGAWEIHSDKLDEDEQKAIRFVGRNRTRKEHKPGDKRGPDFLPEGTIPVDKKKLDGLVEEGWMRRKEDYKGHDFAYDINTKSGVRPKYKRLSRKGVSNTLTTADFTPREKLHPTEDRGLSLREGARIQSFPDSFRFYGSFSDVATQIGNAVPPYLAYTIAKHIQEEGWLEN